MKFLRRFNESLGRFTRNKDKIGIIKDLLLELTDNDISIEVYDNNDYIIIGIGDPYHESEMIKLNDYEMELNNLIDWAKSEDLEFVKLNRTDDLGSYVLNSKWESDLICPECGSNLINRQKENNFEFVCLSCNHKDDLYSFTSNQHPIDLGDLIYFIKNKYWVQYLEICYYI